MSLLVASIGQPDSEIPTRAVNETSQALLTVGVFLALAATLVVAWRMSRARGSYAPVVVVVAAAVGTVNEASWNTLYHLYWYSPDQWTLWTSWGIPQPVWMSGMYTSIYAVPALWALHQHDQGRLTREVVGRLFLVASLAIGVLEVTVISAGIYRYYGHQPFTVLNGKYPLTAALMEGAFIAVFSVAVARVVPLLHGRRVLLIVPGFSLLFCGVFYGGAMPLLVVLNRPHASTAALDTAGLVALALTGSMVWGASLLTPASVRVPSPPLHPAASTT